MTSDKNIEIIEKARRFWYSQNRQYRFSDDEESCMSAALGIARILAKSNQEPISPCAACGYGGKHLDAPPCTNCPAHPKKAEKNERLTLAELRTMDGQPVWCNDSKVWGIVSVDWDFSGNPFLMGRFNRDEFVWDIKQRNLPCYHYPPKEDKVDERD